MSKSIIFVIILFLFWSCGVISFSGQYNGKIFDSISTPAAWAKTAEDCQILPLNSTKPVEVTLYVPPHFFQHAVDIAISFIAEHGGPDAVRTFEVCPGYGNSYESLFDELPLVPSKVPITN
jgi:hypothetical protein